MKKILKYASIVLGVIIVAVIAGLIFFNSTYPKISPPKNIAIKVDDKLLKRGEYLVGHVAACIDCHSKRDFTKFAGPIISGTEGKGGERFDENIGVPGVLYAKNITPVALKNWTDGEILRAITVGLSKDNTVLFPLMPYTHYNDLTEEDAYAIVAYIRTLKPVNSEIPKRSIDFPVNLLMKTGIPEGFTPKKVDRNNKLAYGKYLVNMAGCSDCHTMAKDGKPVEGMEFAGGAIIILPNFTLHTANITPDIETGIGSWTEDAFVKRFKNYSTSESKNIPVKADEFNTIMPWTVYAGMTEEDLKSIYAYLRTLKPVKHKVQIFTLANEEFQNSKK